jgi:gamma-glutamyltranspeptidase/glutathione hydrolase
LDGSVYETMKIDNTKTMIGSLFLIMLISACTVRTEQKNGLITSQAMVVSAHPIASEVGVNILKKGGNAIDAAIAVQFALAVVYPAAGNIGGGGFMVIRQNDGDIFALDFREKAPGQAHRNMYQDENGNVIDELSIHGHLAAGVPGTVAGMVQAYDHLATLPWEELIQPAIDLAENGFPLTEREATRLNEYQEEFMEENTVIPDYLMSDRWDLGDTVYMKDLAGTLERIRDKNLAGFYAGETANLLVSEMERGKGLITLEDLDQYEAIWRNPVVANYKNYKIISMGPPSSGGIALVQLLKLINPYQVDTMNWKGPKYLHLLIEAEKRIYADRAAYLGDEDYYPVPADELISEKYLEKRMRDFSFNRAIPSDSIYAGNIHVMESTETTHFSVVDPQGNAVAVTTTLNGNYGCKVVVGGAGFFLNNEMDDFSIKPGFPNMFGLVGGEANAIEPGKRMLSSMTPTIIEKDDSLYMVIGSPGGARIITSVFQCLLNVTEFNMTMQESVKAGRFHHQWNPDRVYYEPGRITEPVLQILKEKGHSFEMSESIGSVNAILVIPGKGLEGGADPRGDNAAAGF